MKHILLLVVLQFIAFFIQAQQTSVSQVNFRFEKITNTLKAKYVLSSDSIAPYLYTIEKFKNSIVAAEDKQDRDFATALNTNVMLLENANKFTNQADVLSLLKDVTEDLAIKLEGDSVFGLTSAIFEKITFDVDVKKLVEQNLVPANNYRIRATPWGNRDQPTASYRFNDQLANPKLSVSLVRGTYCFWVEPLSGPFNKKQMKITVRKNPPMDNPITIIAP